MSRLLIIKRMAIAALFAVALPAAELLAQPYEGAGREGTGFVGQQHPWRPNNEDVDRINHAFEQAVKAHDATILSGLYAKNAIILPPDSAPVTGEENIRKWSETEAKVWNSLTLTPVDSRFYEGTGWAAGSWKGNAKAPDGKTLDLHGNYLMTLEKKQGEDWRIVADAWNVLPTPPYEATGTSMPPAQK